MSHGRNQWAPLLAALAFAWSAKASAELYSYVDSEGVVHFTNIPKGELAIRPVPNRENTYAWKDEHGTARFIHQVDVDRFDALIGEAADYYSLPPAVVKAVAAAESAFEVGAVSPSGAMGLMQLLPSTAHKMYVRDPLDPKQNLFGGARYLRILANRFQGDLRLTLAAYNAGHKAVERHHDVPPFKETRAYVRRVLSLYRHYLEHWQVSE